MTIGQGGYEYGRKYERRRLSGEPSSRATQRSGGCAPPPAHPGATAERRAAVAPQHETRGRRGRANAARPATRGLESAESHELGNSESIETTTLTTHEIGNGKST